MQEGKSRPIVHHNYKESALYCKNTLRVKITCDQCGNTCNTKNDINTNVHKKKNHVEPLNLNKLHFQILDFLLEMLNLKQNSGRDGPAIACIANPS